MNEILIFLCLWFFVGGPLCVFFIRRNNGQSEPQWAWQDRWAFYLSAIIVGLWMRILES